VVITVLTAFAVGCGTPDQGAKASADAGSDTDTIGIKFDSSDAKSGAGDIAGSETATGDGAGGGTWTRPANAAILMFEVDDTANQTFTDAQMKWTGSFAWNDKDNTVVFATSWLPTDGPFPVLYDDGPISQGGHEHEGATKGDHVFSTEVYWIVDQDHTLEYGVLNELDNWMWEGPNGSLDLAKGQTGEVQVPGLKIHQFGDIDIKLGLDTAELHADFAKVKPRPDDPESYQIFVKGSMNQWTNVQLLDDGTKGDEKAGDGIYTYVQKQRKGAHDGGCYAGQHVQFVWVFAQPGTDPTAGLEYKKGPSALKEGTSGATDAGTPSVFVPAGVVLEKDSKGKVMNTAIVVPDGGAPLVCEPKCSDDQVCVAGQCEAKPTAAVVTSVEPAKGPESGNTAVKVNGKNFAQGAIVSFGGVPAANVMVAGDALSISCLTPEHAPGVVDVIVSNPGAPPATLGGGFLYEATQTGQSPAVKAVEPAWLPAKSGGGVTVTGTALDQVAAFYFGGVQATITTATATSAQLEIGPHSKGVVDLTVKPKAGGKDFVMPQALWFTAFDSPTIDGMIAANNDWDANSKAADNALATEWGSGKNELFTLYLAYDNDNLYVGVKGVVEAGNAIVGLLDIDYGQGTGVADMSKVTDTSGPLDDAISGGFKMATPPLAPSTRSVRSAWRATTA